MALVLDEVYRVSLIFDVNGVAAAVINYVQVTVGGTGFAFDIANEWGDKFATDIMQNVISNECTLKCVGAQRISPTTGARSDVVKNAQGFVVDDSLPSTAAVVARWQTDTQGRSGQGRSFFPGVPEKSTARGRLENAYRSTWTTSIGNYNQPLVLAAGGGTVDLVLWSPTDLVARQITVAGVNQILGIQRGRRAELCA